MQTAKCFNSGELEIFLLLTHLAKLNRGTYSKRINYRNIGSKAF
nr:MAG TPA: hypothetical protein [Caudoviricetes sp.]